MFEIITPNILARVSVSTAILHCHRGPDMAGGPNLRGSDERATYGTRPVTFSSRSMRSKEVRSELRFGILILLSTFLVILVFMIIPIIMFMGG